MSTQTPFLPQSRPGSSPKRPALGQKPVPADNFIESIRDIGSSTANSLKHDFLQGIPEDILKQMFGEKLNVKASGEIQPGHSINIESVLLAERKENKTLKLQLAQEKRLREEEKTLIEKKSQELKIELGALTQEVSQLAKTTQGLAQETQIAVMQAPANPGVYHITFFEKLRQYIASFRENIESAANWMQAYNQRTTKKKGFWGQVGKSGAKRLLSQEDYTQRSAG